MAIISASRRTDMPTFHVDSFLTAVKQGSIQVKNPMFPEKVSTVSLKLEDVDCFVFWTKNPKPLLNRLDELEGYNYYFQFTLNSYGKDIEPKVPAKGAEMLSIFRELYDKIGRDRIVWRYDPILITEKYTVKYHKKYFEELACRLNGMFDHCIISFVDVYGKCKDNFQNYGMRAPSVEEMEELAESFSAVAKTLGFEIHTCAEKIDLEKYGMKHGSCIDPDIIEKITGKRFARKANGQRSECRCLPSIDIGEYDTCPHQCLYCYANKH